MKLSSCDVMGMNPSSIDGELDGDAATIDSQELREKAGPAQLETEWF